MICVQFARASDIEVPLPRYETEDAAGLDLRAAIRQLVSIIPGYRLLIPTGLRIAIPRGYEGQVRPRSGLALKHGVTVLNSPGTIDADFRGEIAVVLVNHGHVPFVVNPLDRIAQLVIAPVTRAQVELVSELSSTTRGEGGYGSTGAK